MEKIFVQPRPVDPKKPQGKRLQVRRESDARPIAAEGAWVERTPYIRRRLAAGDLIVAKPPKAKAKESDKES